MEIRPALLDESMSVLAVQIASYRSWLEFVDFVPALTDSEQDICISIERKKAWVIEMDDAIVGIARFDLCDGVAYIHRLAIHPIHHRHGLGSRLLETIQNAVKHQGGHAIEFRVPMRIPDPRAFLTHHSYERFQIGPSLALFRKDIAYPVQPPPRSYERVGKCNRTGKCCSRIFLIRDAKSLTRENVEKLGEESLRDFNEFTRAVGVHFLGELEDGTAYFRCNQLTFNSNGKAECLLYGPPDMRPPVCSLFPVAPSAYRYRSCGIYFEETSDGEEVEPGNNA